ISRWEEEAKSLGAKGLAWIAHRDEGLKGPVAKFLSDAEWAKIRELTSCEPGDLLLCVADEQPLVEEVLGGATPRALRAAPGGGSARGVAPPPRPGTGLDRLRQFPLCLDHRIPPAGV